MKKMTRILVVVLAVVLTLSLVPGVSFATVFPKLPLTVEINGDVVKEYDGTTEAPDDFFDSVELKGVCGGDDVEIDTERSEAYFDTKDVQNENPFYFTAVITGDDAWKYSNPAPITVQGAINQRPIAVSGIFAPDNKIYDGNNQATGTMTAVIISPERIVEGESIDVVWQVMGEPEEEIFGAFSDEKAGKGKEVEVDADALEPVIVEGEYSDNYCIFEDEEEGWEIEVGKADILPDTFTVKPIAKQQATGKKIEPSIAATGVNSGETLVAGKDFTVEYKNNVSAGKAEYIVTGIGNYEGCVVKGTFEIADVKTGDEMNIGMYVLMAVIAGFAVSALMIRRKAVK